MKVHLKKSPRCFLPQSLDFLLLSAPSPTPHSDSDELWYDGDATWKLSTMLIQHENYQQCWFNTKRIGCYPSLRFLFSLFSAIVTTVEKSVKAKLHIKVDMHGQGQGEDKINKEIRKYPTGKKEGKGQGLENTCRGQAEGQGCRQQGGGKTPRRRQAPRKRRGHVPGKSL